MSLENPSVKVVHVVLSEDEKDTLILDALPPKEGGTEHFGPVKFLYFILEDESELMLIGWSTSYQIPPVQHRHLLERYVKKTDASCDEEQIKGAGDLYFNENRQIVVSGWRSEGYGVWTPPELRSRMFDLLGTDIRD
jgi:hypothetical protein